MRARVCECVSWCLAFGCMGWSECPQPQQAQWRCEREGCRQEGLQHGRTDDWRGSLTYHISLSFLRTHLSRIPS